MSAAEPTNPPPAPRLSGRVVVIAFVTFIIVGTVGSILLAKRMRPITMPAREKIMPLAGTVEMKCIEPGGKEHNIREQGTCPKGGALTFSVPDAGKGLQQVTFAVLTQSAEQPPLIGQFTREGFGRVELQGLDAGPYMAAFVYSTEPIEASKVATALTTAPRTDIPKQEHALEVFVSDQLRAKKEARLARVYFKVTE